MSNEQEVKKLKAKLYNLKSGIDGIIQFVDKNIMDIPAAIDGLGALVADVIEGMGSNSST